MIRNVGLCTNILTVYLKNDILEEKLSLFLQIEHEDAVPNDHIFAVVLNPSASLSALVTELHCMFTLRGFKGHLLSGVLRLICILVCDN